MARKSTMHNGVSAGSSGLAIDTYGVPVLDPTKNVLDLVEAAIDRVTDVSAVEIKRLDARILHHSEHDIAMHAMEAAAAESAEKLMNVQVAHAKELQFLSEAHQKDIRDKETDRLNAIRTVDVAAVAEAARVSAAAAATLATTVTASAEALRTQVATVATAQGNALAAALEPIQKSIEDLRKTQYEQQGQRAAAVESRVAQRDTRDDARTSQRDLREDRSDFRGNTQWTIVLSLGIVWAIVQVVLHFWK